MKHPITDSQSFYHHGIPGCVEHQKRIMTPIGHLAPVELCRMFEIAIREALEELEQIRTEKIAVREMPEYATAISRARVFLQVACQCDVLEEDLTESEGLFRERMINAGRFTLTRDDDADMKLSQDEAERLRKFREQGVVRYAEELANMDEWEEGMNAAKSGDFRYDNPYPKNLKKRDAWNAGYDAEMQAFEEHVIRHNA